MNFRYSLRVLILNILLLLSVSYSYSIGGEDNLVLNEFCASNSSIIADEQNQYNDWIEIFNPGAEQVDLSGAFLTDNLSEPAKWKFPQGTIIAAKQYLLIWADGTARPDGLHTNFKLSSAGEELALVSSNGVTIIDTIVFGEQETDTSYGRFPDGEGEWGKMQVPTPGKANTEILSGELPNLQLSHQRGHYTSSFELTLSCNDPDAEIYYTTDQTEPGVYAPFVDADKSLGNPIIGDAFIVDGFKGCMVINLADTYTNTSDTSQTIVIKDFVFYARQQTSPVTPFVVRVNGNRDFTALALGKSRVPDEYNPGINSFAFSDQLKRITLQPGWKIAAGYMDAYANGSGGEAGSVIPFDFTQGNMIFFTGNPEGVNQGVVTEGSKVIFSSYVDELDRDYRFQVIIEYESELNSEPVYSMSGILYNDPISIDKTTTLRAIAVKKGWRSSPLENHTYLFVDDIIAANYMWTSITGHPVWGKQIKPALLDLPSVSVIVQGSISSSEQASSIEIIYPDGNENFQINSGIETMGSGSVGYPKKSARLSFKGKYGYPIMKYKLYDELDATDQFDQLILHSGAHDAVFWEEGTKGIYLRNQWAFQRQREMGHASSHGKYIHLYINGQYNGLYNIFERPNAAFMASYYGGDKDDYTSVNKGIVIDGFEGIWNSLKNSVSSYENMTNYFDLTSYADYMLFQFYCGNDWDWLPKQNWMASGSNLLPANFQFFSWDNDMILRRSVSANVIRIGGPESLWNSVIQHKGFKVLFADRIHKFLLSDDCMFTPGNVKKQLESLSSGIELSMVAEAARWGRAYNYTPTTWQNTVNQVLNYVENRTDIVIQQLRNEGLIAPFDPPEFLINGKPLSNNTFSSGDLMSFKDRSEVIYYTTDGSDPFDPIKETISATAIKYEHSVSLTDSVVINARAFLNNDWSALSSKEFILNSDSVTSVSPVKQMPQYSLGYAYPNPFNDQTQISFLVRKEGRVRILVYNALGILVQTLTDNDFSEGEYKVTWNGKYESGQKVESGVYFLVMQVDGKTWNRKVIVY